MLWLKSDIEKVGSDTHSFRGLFDTASFLGLSISRVFDTD